MPAQPMLFDTMGNDDPDLGSPHHDAAMFWLDRYIRSGKFIKTWLHGTDDWKGYFDKRPELLEQIVRATTTTASTFINLRKWNGRHL